MKLPKQKMTFLEWARAERVDLSNAKKVVDDVLPWELVFVLQTTP